MTVRMERGTVPIEDGTVQDPAKPRSDLHPVIASGAVRALLLPVSAVLTLGTSSILVRSVGATAYGAVIFIGTLFQLLPFADLGVAAAVTRAVAASDDPAHDVYVAAVLRRCLRVMSLSGCAIALIAVVIGGFGAWGPILGLAGQVKHANLAATATIAIFGLALPLALGQRVLLGAGKNHLSIAVGIVQPTTALVLSVMLWALGAPAGAFVLIYPIGLVVNSTTTTLLARHLTGLRISPLTAIRSLPAGASEPKARIMSIAVPMFMLSVGLPIGLQCDKFVISHRLPPHDLSEYALCSQLYVPGWLVLSAAAFALLPVFTRRRAKGLPHRQLWARLTLAFGASSVVLGLVFTLAAPYVARLITSGRVHIGLDLRLAFAALLVVQTTGLVSAMVLNRPAEMRIQAYFVAAMMVSNVALSWVLAGRIGVAGPVVASAVTVGLLDDDPVGDSRVTQSRVHPIDCRASVISALTTSARVAT